LYDYPALVQEVQSSSLRSFDESSGACSSTLRAAVTGLRAIHDQVWDNFRAGDRRRSRPSLQRVLVTAAASAGG